MTYSRLSAAFATAAALAMLYASPAFAGSTTISGKDATGASVSMGAVDNGSGGPKSPTTSLVDSGAGDVTDATNHAVKIEGYGDGWDPTQGAKADAACGSDTGTCTWIAIAKRIAQNLTTLNSTAGNSLAAGTNVVGKFGIDQTTDGTTNAVHLVAGTALAGKFGIDQTTPGTTNGVQDAATSATGSAVPAKAIYAGAQSDGNVGGLIQASHSAFLNMTTATTTKIITGTAAKKVYITAFRVHAGGTTTGKFVEGTGSNCGTGTADLSETWDLTASDGSNQGNGVGPVLVMATAGDDVCFTNSAAVNDRIGVAYETH